MLSSQFKAVIISNKSRSWLIYYQRKENVYASNQSDSNSFDPSHSKKYYIITQHKHIHTQKFLKILLSFTACCTLPVSLFYAIYFLNSHHDPLNCFHNALIGQNP